jgi:ribonuclease HI
MPAPAAQHLAALLTFLRGDSRTLRLSGAERAALADWLAANLSPPLPGAPAPPPPAIVPAAAIPGPGTGAGTGGPAAAAGWLLLFTDGASRGNPGPAAAGIVLYGSAAEGELHREGQALGVLTNNQAEYRALLLGLAAARRLGGARVEIAMDSELIVRQLQGRYKVKHPQLKPLHEQARFALAAFTAWRVRHVPRAENALADALANQALDSL